MAIETATTVPAAIATRRPEGRFYIGMAFVALVTAIAGFGPAIVDPASRREPLNWLVGVHGALFLAWLVLFLTQALLVSWGRYALHRRLGLLGAGMAAVMVVTGYFTTVTMVRRGYDLSGDLMGDSGDPLMVMVFQLGDLLCFGLLVAIAILLNRRPEVHKRLMLLATIGGLMPAALSHIIGHSEFLRGFPPVIILVPYTAMLFAGAIHDLISRGRIHPVSFWVALGIFVWSNVRATVIGPSEAWREFGSWLIR
jgi:hypothetical protein